MLEVNDKIKIPWAEFTVSFARSSGPGGQNVNKVNSKALIDWSIVNSPSIPEGVRRRFLESFSSRITTDGRVVIASDEHRAQEANLKACYEKLRDMLLAVAVPPKIRRPTKPTRGSKERRLSDKRQNSENKKQRQKFGVE